MSPRFQDFNSLFNELILIYQKVVKTVPFRRNFDISSSSKVTKGCDYLRPKCIPFWGCFNFFEFSL